jgi:hypothetical protein
MIDPPDHTDEEFDKLKRQTTLITQTITSLVETLQALELRLKARDKWIKSIECELESLALRLAELNSLVTKK